MRLGHIYFFEDIRMASFGTFFHGKMTGVEITCIQSFLDHGHDVEVFSYCNCGAPNHFKVSSAQKILRKRDLFRYESGPGQGSVSAFTNWFRYALMASLDVWWIDTDMICLSRDWPQGITPICAAWEDENQIGTAVLRLQRDFAAKLSEAAAALGRKIEWGQTGPSLITNSVRSDHLLAAGILPASAFYPLHYSEWTKARLPECRDEVQAACNSSYAFHLWNEMGRRIKLDKGQLPHRESFLGSIVQLYGTANYFQPGLLSKWRSVLKA